MNAAKKTVLLVLVSLLPLSLSPAIRAAESSEGLKVRVEYDSFGAHVVTDLEITTNVWREGGNVTATATCSSHYMPGSLPDITEPVDTGIWQFTVALLLGEAEIVSYSPPLTGKGRVNKWSEGCSVVWELPQGDPKALYRSGTTFTATFHLGTPMPGREPSIAAFAHGADQDKWAKLVLRVERDILIRQDGSIDPSDAPISREGDVFTLTEDVESRVRVYRSNCVIDGKGHTIGQVDTGLHLEARNVSIKNLILTHCDLGINVSGGGEHSLLNNTVDQNQRGILVQTSSGNLLSGNIARFNTLVGIHLRDSNENYVFGNAVTGNGLHGIVLDRSCTNSIEENLVAKNNGSGIVLEGTYGPTTDNSLVHNVVTENAQHGILVLRTARNNALSNNSVTSNALNGIALYSTTENKLSNNNATANQGNGIYLEASHGNTLVSNEVARNTKAGILLSSASNGNLIHDDLVTDNADNGVLVMASSSNAFTSNNFKGNGRAGVSLVSGSTANTVANNTFQENKWLGMQLGSSSGNAVYHNAFLNNSAVGGRQVQIIGSTGIWDKGYPSGGNYWSDHSCNDTRKGSDQDEAGSDGIVDIPYVIDAENRDRYPLVKGDLSIQNLTLVQVVLDPKALVAGKEAAIRVDVLNTYRASVRADIHITYDFGTKTFIEKGPNGKGVLLSSGPNRIYIPGGPAFPGQREPWQLEEPRDCLYWTDTGVDDKISAIVDPDDEVSEASEENNQKTISMKVVESRGLRVLCLPVFFPEMGEEPLDPSHLSRLLEVYGHVTEDIFPVAGDNFCWTPFAQTPWPGIIPEGLSALQPSLRNKAYEWLYEHVCEPMTLAARMLGYDRAVIVIQQDFGGVAIGIGRTPEDPIPVVVGDVPSHVPAHEIGHTYHLWHPHDEGPPVYNAEVYDVQGRNYEVEAKTFMAYGTGGKFWIDKGRYDSDPKEIFKHGDYERLGWNLLDQFVTGQDPETIMVRGTILKNNTIAADKPWYRLAEGTTDLSSGNRGDYSIVLLNSQNQILGRFGFNASFTRYVEINHTFAAVQVDSVPFILSIPYLPGTSTVQIRDTLDRALLTRSVTSNKPTVTITSPNGGEALMAGVHYSVTWQSSDLDGDTLTYLLAYSEDNGETWAPLAVDLKENRCVWDTACVPEGTRYLVKVIASDGTNAGEDRSDGVFAILSGQTIHPPEHQRISDPAGDLVNAQGRPTAGEGYLDITGVDVVLEGSSYTARINLSGSLPASLSDPSVYIEWDLLVDSDRNPDTRSWGPWALLDNGLGVDVVARIILGSSGYAGQVLTWPGGKTVTKDIPFKVDGTIAELRFDASLIGNPAAFDYVVAVRKNVKNQMTAADKCPNDGHATAPVGEQKEAFMVALVGLLVAAGGTTRIRGPDGCSTEETSWPEN